MIIYVAVIPRIVKNICRDDEYLLMQITMYTVVLISWIQNLIFHV